MCGKEFVGAVLSIPGHFTSVVKCGVGFYWIDDEDVQGPFSFEEVKVKYSLDERAYVVAYDAPRCCSCCF